VSALEWFGRDLEIVIVFPPAGVTPAEAGAQFNRMKLRDREGEGQSPIDHLFYFAWFLCEIFLNKSFDTRLCFRSVISVLQNMFYLGFIKGAC